MNTKSNMYHNKIDKQFTNNSIFYSTLEKNNKVFEIGRASCRERV